MAGKGGAMGKRLLVVVLVALVAGCSRAGAPTRDAGDADGSNAISQAHSKTSDLAYAPGRAIVGLVTVKSVGRSTYDRRQKVVMTPVQVEQVDAWAGVIPSTLWVFGGKAAGKVTGYDRRVPVPNMASGDRFFVRVATGRPILVLALPVAGDGTISVYPGLGDRVTDDVDGGDPGKVDVVKLKAAKRP